MDTGCGYGRLLWFQYVSTAVWGLALFLYVSTAPVWGLALGFADYGKFVNSCSSCMHLAFVCGRCLWGFVDMGSSCTIVCILSS